MESDNLSIDDQFTYESYTRAFAHLSDDKKQQLFNEALRGYLYFKNASTQLMAERLGIPYPYTGIDR